MMRLVWFSPLSPAKTDIANYTVRVVDELRRRAQVELVDTGGAARQSARTLNRSDLCLYQIGNNPDFHGPILSAAAAHPGVIVLHDRAINELCFGMTEPADMDEAAHRQDYRTVMACWHGRDGLAAARRVLDGTLPIATSALHYPLFESALHRALGAVTHNRDVADEVRAAFPHLPVLCLPLPYPQPAQRPAMPALRGPDQPLRLVMFGFMNANRRACEVIEAWAASPWRDRFTLDIAGEAVDRARLDATAARLGLAEQVRHHGFVAEADLDALIRSADLVLNLRNPSMGEASGSQLRIWANARAAAVSDTGWYAQLPDDCVRKIGLEREHDDLLALLTDLATGRLDLAALADAGFARLAAHDPAQYAATLVQWLADQRDTMFAQWTRTALIEAAAQGHAGSLPGGFTPQLPACLTPLEN